MKLIPYIGIMLLILVFMAALLVLPSMPPALPVLLGIFPIAFLNVVGAWALIYHYSRTKQS
jgi:hypothetical protein